MTNMTFRMMPQVRGGRWMNERVGDRGTVWPCISCCPNPIFRIGSYLHDLHYIINKSLTNSNLQN